MDGNDRSQGRQGCKRVDGGELECLMTVEETAEAMGTTPRIVRMLERRALRKLRKALEELGYHSADDLL